MLINLAYKGDSYSLSDITSDIIGLITGTITSISGLSSSVDKDISTTVGSAPSTATYTLVYGTPGVDSSFILKKTHHTLTTREMFFKLQFTLDANTSNYRVYMTQGIGWVEGTATLVNSTSNTLGVQIGKFYPGDNHPIKHRMIVHDQHLTFWSWLDLSVAPGGSYITLTDFVPNYWSSTDTGISICGIYYRIGTSTVNHNKMYISRTLAGIVSPGVYSYTSLNGGGAASHGTYDVTNKSFIMEGMQHILSAATTDQHFYQPSVMYVDNSIPLETILASNTRILLIPGFLHKI